MAGVERSVPERMEPRRCSHERRPADPIPGHGAAQPAGGLGEPPERQDRHALPAGRGRCRRGRFCLRSSRSRSSTTRWRPTMLLRGPARTASGKRSPTSPRSRTNLPGRRCYLRHLEAAKSALTIPVIASLNGTTRGGWTRYARMIAGRRRRCPGAQCLLRRHRPRQTAADVEARYIDLVPVVRASIAIPLAVKIGPFFSCLPNMARRLLATGADGLVLFNRFLQPDISLETADGDSPARAQHQRRASPAAPLDRHSPRA